MKMQRKVGINSKQGKQSKRGKSIYELSSLGFDS